MARQTREFYKGGFWHIVNRGVMRSDIFRSKDDFAFLLYKMKEVLKKCPVNIHSFNFLSNHLHYFIEQIDENFPPSKYLAGVHTALGLYINKKYGRVGHLFQNRCTVKPVERDERALEVSFYINLNKVLEKLQNFDRSKVVSEQEVEALLKEAELDPWCSYGVYCGIRDDAITKTDFIFSLLDDDHVKARAKYRALAKNFITSGYFLKTRDLRFGDRLGTD